MDRRILFLPSLVYLAAFGLYLLHLAPGAYVGDSGEFCLQVSTLGISHPPGYPAYSLFGRLASAAFPWANLDYRANLASALPAAGAAGLLAATCLRMGWPAWAGLFAGLSFAAADSVLGQAVVAEVYGIQVFWVGLALWALALSGRSIGLLLAFLAGTGFAVHYLAGVLVGAVWILAVCRNTALPRTPTFYNSIIIFWRRMYGGLLRGAPVFLLGLSLLLFMPVRSSARPVLDWGQTRTASGFWNQVRRVQYKTLEGSYGFRWEAKREFLKKFGRQMWSETTPIHVLLALVGILAWRRKISPRLPCAPGIGWGGLAVVFLNGPVLLGFLQFEPNPETLSIVEPYFLAVVWVLCLWAAAGLVLLWQKFRPAAILTFLFLGPWAGAEGQRQQWLARDYAMNILRSLPTGGHFFSSGDNQMFLLGYLRFAEGRRPDLHIYTDTGFVFGAPYHPNFHELDRAGKDRARRIFQERIASHSVYKTFFSLGSSAAMLPIPSRPWGLIYRWHPEPTQGGEGDPWPFYRQRGLEKALEGEYMLKDVAVQYLVMKAEDAFRRKDRDRGLEFSRRAAGHGLDLGWVGNNLGAILAKYGLEEEAGELYRKAVARFPSDEKAWMNLALYYERRGETEKMREAFHRADALPRAGGHPALYLGIDAYKRGDLDVAQRYFRRALERDPYLADAAGNLAIVLEKRGRPAEAEELHREAIRLAPERTSLRHNLAAFYWKQGRISEAARQWEEILRLKPEHSEARRWLGLARRRLGG